ncbi:MAG: protein kinase [Myxococcaceae bacterium]|nr:protein kinase [Myxococcaceae bacterium]
MTEGHPLSPGIGVHPNLLPPGTEVNGFRLVRHLVSGGYGSVWLVESILHPGRLYALKFSLYPPGTPRQADERAVREVRLLLQAAHPNVVRVVAHGRWEDPETGLHYVVLEWVEGSTLLTWARQHNPSLRHLVRLFQKVVRALQAAHEAGVMHRDVKPDNVLVREVDSEPFLVDFGAGNAEGSPSLTQEGLPPGTPDFRSPEALSFSLRADGTPYSFQPADDWYAVGVMLYLLLTEVLPFPARLGGVDFKQWVVWRRPVPPRLLNPRVPGALSRVVMRLLAKEPGSRPKDGYALCEALEKALTEGDWDAPVYAPREPRPLEKATTQAPTPGDGPAAEDPETQIKHLIRQEQGEEVARREAVARRRDELLPAQPGVWRPALRRATASAVLLSALVAIGGAAWSWLSTAPLSLLSSEPATTLPSPPAEAPDTPPTVSPQSPAAPQPPLLKAPTAPPPTLVSTDASPLKEDSTVKTSQRPRAGQAAATTPSRSVSKSVRNTLCAAGVAATAAGCPSAPVRPDVKECPLVATESMQRLKIMPSVEVGVLIDASSGYIDDPTFRAGPIVSTVDDSGHPAVPEDSLLFGEVLPSGGEFFYIRYRELQAPDKPRVPICAVVRQTNETGIEKQPGSTADAFKVDGNKGVARFVYTFAE